MANEMKNLMIQAQKSEENRLAIKKQQQDELTAKWKEKGFYKKS